jgi:hypothetical protein
LFSLSTRYKNGEKLPSNHVKYFEYPIAKIESIDPEDEGLYQCLARNDFGEISNTFYLHIRPSIMLMNAPQNAKCFPMDKGEVLVTFNKEVSTNKIQFFVASDSPRDFHSALALNATIKSFVIDSKAAGFYKPLKPFYLYMRNMSPSASNHAAMVLSQLSKPIKCATQGIEAKFVKPENGIFLRWDAPKTDSIITSYTIQFLTNGSSNSVVFNGELIGTYETFPMYVSWETVEKKLEKISVKSYNNSEWSEVKVPGNVTGLYIINTDEINVRILGSVMEDGELFEQDLKFIKWTNIKAASISLEPLEVSEIESRSAVISWGKTLVLTNCSAICSNLKSEIISRDSSEKFQCVKM